ncbi:uncharacterized protein LOC111003549 [Pieris rapae]|uniref:uncharacterized protein LOC111003549 n=1 Tax=Pieris rapae TaxID=64459 RepID=UPI001E27FF74|nr:uncharacterized protein LOC111003549 [Pieris rapae]
MIKVYILVLLFGLTTSDLCGGDECHSGGNATRVLSRSKRFLIFPEGSSFQMVFCTQTAALIPIGDIFLFANTAALAWDLPSDPKLLLMFKEYERKPNRRNDEKSIYYLDENGRVIAKKPFRRPTIVNPAFAKRSVNEESFRDRLNVKIDRMKMHERHGRDYLRHNEGNSEFHRNSRAELYQKLETLISALGSDGRQCVLRKLCESSRARGQGTFLQELLRVVFTFPKDKNSSIEEHKLYDQAHDPSKDCEIMYPGCENFDLTSL